MHASTNRIIHLKTCIYYIYSVYNYKRKCNIHDRVIKLNLITTKLKLFSHLEYLLITSHILLIYTKQLGNNFFFLLTTSVIRGDKTGGPV